MEGGYDLLIITTLPRWYISYSKTWSTISLIELHCSNFGNTFTDYLQIITNENANGAPNFTHGVNGSGVVTAIFEEDMEINTTFKYLFHKEGSSIRCYCILLMVRVIIAHQQDIMFTSKKMEYIRW